MMKENTQPLVSILIPLYNQERYFKACIKSVEKQTYKNLEIIIVNDGSTDRSPQMARDWAARDNRVKVIDKQNEGLAFARRDGYLVATGDYVAFLDSDDLLTSQAIQALVTCAIDYDVDLVMGSFEKKLGIINRHLPDDYFSFPFNQKVEQPELFEKYYIGFFRNDVFPMNVWAKLYRKSVIDKAYQQSELYSSEIPFMGEDQFFNVNLFPYLNAMYRIKNSVYIYRYGGGTFGFNKNFPQLFTCSDKRLRLLDKFNYVEGYKFLYEEYVACFYHYAAQMIYYKKTGKDEVIAFFKHEIIQRELVPRLMNYYSQDKSPSKEVRLLINRDYDGMYQYACNHAIELFGSIAYRLFSCIVKLFERLS